MASFVNNAGAEDLTSGGSTNIWASGTIKVRLVISSITPDKDDTSMTGYTAATGSTDQTLGSKTKTKDTTNDRIVFDAADATFSAVASGSTVGWLVFYKFITNDAGSLPYFIADVTDTPTNGSDIVASLSASGIGYLQQ